MDTLTYKPYLLRHAAHLWMVSGSATPPMLHEIEMRDMAWDNQVAMMRQAMELMIDAPKNPFGKGAKDNGKT